MKRERLEHEKDLKSKHRKMMDVEKKDRQRVFELSTDGMESEFINRIRISEETLFRNRSGIRNCILEMKCLCIKNL